MTNLELLQGCIDYIERNLRAEINQGELAGMAGFSPTYFSWLFHETVGMTVSAYITKRRLLHAVYGMENATAADSALEYGFDSYAGFYKAFRKEFGCSPRKYRRLVKAEKPEPFNVHKKGKLKMTHTEIKNILKNWDITVSEILPVYIIGGSKTADNAWNINNGYILKRGTDFAALRKNIAIAKELAKQGLTAGIPVVAIDGTEFICRDDCYYYLSVKMPGRELHTDERYDGDIPRISYEYGAAIARLHQALQHITPGAEIKESDLFRQVENWAMPITKTAMKQWELELPEEFYAEYLGVFNELCDKLPRQIIHRDTHAGNIIVDGGKVSGFVDFDISQINVRLLDPCYCATGILSEAFSRPDGFEKWPAFLAGILRGYDSVSKLDENEWKAVPYVIYSIQMVCVAYFTGIDEYREVGAQNRKMLKWIWDNRESCFAINL